MLDRTKGHQYHYYQPGIGTYVTSTSLSHTGTFHRIKSAYLKAKDSAIGSSFDEHVMGGYKFLMRYYVPGDDIYFFGFSRGAYIARFLAEMLDYIGLLEAGNEELIRFAWKTFAKWQQRRGDTEEDQEKKKKLFNYMKAFRETFSRPVTRIRFMGLFDTVNSVPRFESAWMQRSKFPYTARSSARVIRHAVSIDERRAKFRQDLISEGKPWHSAPGHAHHLRPHMHLYKSDKDAIPKITLNNETENEKAGKQEEKPSKRDRHEGESVYRTPRSSRPGSMHDEHRYRASSPNDLNRKLNLAVPMPTASTEDLASITSGVSAPSLQVPSIVPGEDEATQNIQEVWFAGQHGDIGGGWPLQKGEVWPMSHVPLVWMVQEAQRAGLQFDPVKMKQFQCCPEEGGHSTAVRDFCQDLESHGEREDGKYETSIKVPENEDSRNQTTSSDLFLHGLDFASTKAVRHDCLLYGGGLPWSSVLSWSIMEYLPFRRMDLQSDGSWKPIRWPLPCGEVRDIPNDAQIHVSVIRRLKSDPSYRPGNLIIGGGGRGVKKAPAEHGIGEWVVFKDEGDPVRETYIRKSEAKKSEKEQ
jgi:uncharacterized protein (DUF2235 family)